MFYYLLLKSDIFMISSNHQVPAVLSQTWELGHYLYYLAFIIQLQIKKCFCIKNQKFSKRLHFSSGHCFSALGYRSVPLKNGFSENLELSSLLVHVQQLKVRKHKPTSLF